MLFATKKIERDIFSYITYFHKSEKFISEPHLKVQTFIPPVKNVPGR